MKNLKLDVAIGTARTLTLITQAKYKWANSSRAAIELTEFQVMKIFPIYNEDTKLMTSVEYMPEILNR